MKNFRVVYPSLLMLLLSTPLVQAQNIAVPNPSFEEGSDTPTGWQAGGSGKTVWANVGHSGKRSIAVEDCKEQTTIYWSCKDLNLETGQTYRLSFWSRADNAGTGSVISGLNSANRDFSASPTWKEYSFIFTATQSQEPTYLRLGQWNGTGRVYFDDVRLTQLDPLFAQRNGHELGAGESIENGVYHFNAPLLDGNFSRNLVSAEAGFNSNRWVFGSNAQVVYRHDAGAAMQKSARLRATINYYTGGRLLVEASRDGQQWVLVGELEKQGQLDATLPTSLFPAQTVWVRLKAAAPARGAQDSSPGAFQINNYLYDAPLEGKPADARGQTTFLETTKTVSTLGVHVDSLGDLRPGGANTARLTLTNAAASARSLKAVLSFLNGGKTTRFEKNIEAQPGRTELDIPYTLFKSGDFQARLELMAANQPLYDARTSFDIPALYAADFGSRVGAFNDVWWSTAPYKISRDRPLPAASAKSAAITISAARHEYEPFQVVARPERDVRGLRVTCDGLTGPNGARIAANNIEICEVAYVKVTTPTDPTGTTGDWPDPLPPHRAPLDLKANQNQPFWVTVYVPESAKPGVYNGTLKMTATGWSRAVPVRLVVRNFTLPKETHVQSGFGLGTSRLAPYHNLDNREELAQVMEKYYANFAAHRIAPYSPVFDAPIKVDWGLKGGNWQGGTLDSAQPFAGTTSLRVDDDKAETSVMAAYEQNIPVVPGKPYRLQYAARTAKPGQDYLVTVSTYDAKGNWIAGNNIDFRRTGSGAWEKVEVDFGARLKPQAASIQIHLRPVSWSEAGTETGTAWFDDVQVLDGTGANLLRGGDFEKQAVDPAQVKVDFSAFDAAATKAFNKYKFSAWDLPLQGLGGGTFHERRLGRIGSFDEGTPEYETLLASYLRQVQDHLEEKGWLKNAYIYWFDEPEPKDYEFVRSTMARIHKYAPKLTRMLTEQPEKELFGSVDLWCPVTSSFDENAVRERMRAGDRFWWYVCTVPKAPFATEFIDHPGVEMRTWLWQTWKHQIQGILIWESVYWTSEAAYPDALQNPWQDPMSWVSGYSQPRGTRAPWGNGDGRLLYPPNRNPGVDKKKYLEGPVNSIRWEMLREGIEDYEYFWLLRQHIQTARKAAKTPAQKAAVANAEKLLVVPTAVTRDMTTFATDPVPIYAHRAKLAAEIERLAAIK